MAAFFFFLRSALGRSIAQAAEKGEEEDENAAFLTFLLALCDYETFVEMMRETAMMEAM